MPKFAANLSMMFQEIGFLDRFDAAARAGFKAVEFLFPYDHPPATIAERLERNRLSLALFNTAAGDWAGGERGLAALPGREQEFRDGVDKAIGLRQGDAVPARAHDGRAVAGGARQGSGRARLCRQSALGRRPGRHRRPHRRHRADQHPRHPGLFPQLHRAGDADHRARRPAQSEAPARPLSRADHGGRSRHQDPRAGRPLPACPDRRQSRPPRARYRRDPLPLSVRPLRRDRLCRLDRLRVPPAGRHGGRARLGRELWDRLTRAARRRCVLRDAPCGRSSG